MKKLGIVLVAAFAAFAASSAHASGTATANATANIVVGISIANNTGLNFGQVVPGATAGTVVVPAVASPTRTATGGTVLGNVGSTSSTSFTVTGAANATYTIPAFPNSFTVTDGTNTMVVNTFTASTYGTLSAGGTQTFYMGATLNVGASQPFTGPFNGTYTVTVAYN
jgi:hypothetical protein